MTTFATIPPARRPELVMGPVGADGQRVVKDPRSGRYYHLGEQETFLLTRLDGTQSAEAICTAFEAKFGEPLSQDDLGDFLEVAGEQGLINSAAGSSHRAAPELDEFDDEDDDLAPRRRLADGSVPF
ncbi:PqqD family protein [Singulisphaera sp. Ch08]|uniref:PqqD family protein n=1 Tax=Singulisphaera sp. Ch08 TaxID=3120278 RepID=A0AAU7CEH4_9BACT